MQPFPTAPTAILGAGLMGISISAAHLRCGLPVILYDSAETALETAPQRLREELRQQNQPFRPSSAAYTRNLHDVLPCRIVIESIPEKIRAKQKLYQQLTEIAPPELLLLTNTSTISISLLAEKLPADRQQQFCGFHFFHPVRQRPLLEIIAGKNTAPAAVQAAVHHAQKIGKYPITVGDSPGFLVNRILHPLLSAALSLLEEGIDLRQIETAALNFGMKMGPFRLMDEIGLDVVLHAGWVLFKAFPERAVTHPVLLQLIERGEMGRKSGTGFMTYRNAVSGDGCGEPRPQFLNSNSRISETEIVRRLFLPMYEEAVRCCKEGVIGSADAADSASVEALGFPAAKKGIISWGKHFLENPNR
ncbi:MAG: 3-hydroxyacyl-CoA dehydrogenase family protein [Planctomycetaceae bacterium]|jgi:3-hydroxyacyl-CoA dehydrogenase/enoyl-CoA hydratase/3-hydroxybutyryl-CoA epimerase/enoyl-CoA isomerase|nr:3-hydroxyacyl-CoA dehydrogenase family protein [Planctomycetaceae bacterium]